MNIKNLPKGPKYPEEFNVVVELTRGSRNKYEYDEELDIIKLDRVYTSAMSLPCDYGFIPQTRSEDNDHLDALVLVEHSVFPGCMVTARPIGLLKMIDGGEADEKIISVPVDDIRMKHIQSLDDLSPHFKQEIQHYFEHYKDLQDKKVEITGWGDKDQAIEVLKRSIEE
ncbi:MAG: inorganic diphosphatase [Candidatus Daviesbacteria bacterium]|nr:inorganic diphosphatase [Candidatus Daviesbacteria bacterium]